MSSHRSSEFELFKNARIPSATNSLKRREASDIQSRITVESIQDLILEKGQPITVTQIVTELLPSATRKEREKRLLN